MNLSTFKIRIKNDNVKEDNVLLAIHSPLEVFYLSVKDSALKDIPEDFRKDYLITECDFFDGEEFCSQENIICTLEDIFTANDFKDFCYKIHVFTSRPLDDDFYYTNVLRKNFDELVLEEMNLKEVKEDEQEI